MKKHFLLLLTVSWLAAITVGISILWVYESTPGGDVRSPRAWPSQSGIPHTLARPTLVMFVHPNCPCTRASMGELSVLMTHCQNLADVYVLFLQPKGEGDDWLHTDLWRTAEAIPGVRVLADRDGNEAQRFQATTSGHVVLYDAHGDLIFSGGITSSRGHYGDNSGLSDVMERLRHGVASLAETPVYGCSLLTPKSESMAKNPVCIR
jgi:hypothetical protein